MPFRAVLELPFSSDNDCQAAEAALSSEAGAGRRTRTVLKRAGKTLTAEIVADDIVALRAAGNALLRLAQAIHAVAKVANEEEEKE